MPKKFIKVKNKNNNNIFRTNHTNCYVYYVFTSKIDNYYCYHHKICRYVMLYCVIIFLTIN